MKALTVWQPWASLIMIGAKPNEFRRWDYRVRQPGVCGQRIIIHAGQRPIRPAEVRGVLDLCLKGHGTLINSIAIPFLERLMAAHKCRGVVETAAVLGTVTIGVPFKVGRFEPDSDRVEHHMFAWPMIDPVPFEAPVPRMGAQGFWNYDGEVGHGPGATAVPAAVHLRLDGDDPGGADDHEPGGLT